MRNTMGRYIDGLTDVERDRLVIAQNWANWTPYGGNRCLVAHAQDADHVDYLELGCDYDGSPADAFDSAVERFGIDRVVRAIKLRASASLPSALTEPLAEVGRILDQPGLGL